MLERMPLPVDLQTGTVTGTLLEQPTGTPLEGRVAFTMRPQRLTGFGGEVVLVQKPVVVSLDAFGSFSLVLPATDDPDYSPLDFTYKVEVMPIGGGGYVFDIQIPAGTTVDISSVVGTDPSTGASIIKGDKGDQGDAGIASGSLPTAIAFRHPLLENWFAALQSGVSEVVILGDSLASLGFSWNYTVEETLLNTWGTKPYTGGWRYGQSAVAPSLAGTGTEVLDGAGKSSVSLAAGQGRTASGKCDRLSVVWKRQAGGGILTIRDGGPAGAIMGTIDTSGATAWSNVTEISFPSYLDRTVWIGSSVAASVVEAVHLSSGVGPRVWSASKPGQTLREHITTHSNGLDLISSLSADLVIIAAGHNDVIANYETDLPLMVAEIQSRVPTADILIWIPWQTLVIDLVKIARMRTAALATGLPIVDSGQIGSAVGNKTLSSDQIHPANAAVRMQADQILVALMGDALSAGAIAASRTKITETWRDINGQTEHGSFGGHPIVTMTATGQTNPQIAFYLEALAALGGYGGPTLTLTKDGGTAGAFTVKADGSIQISKGDGTLEVTKVRLKNLAAIPAGPNVVGETCVVLGKHRTCTVDGTPGTWVVTGTQT